MRVLFVDNILVEGNDRVKEFELQPHLGLISLIAVAEQAGHEGVLYDPKLGLVKGELVFDKSLYQGIARAVLDRSPDVVGLTTLGCNFICTIKIASYIKQMSPGTPVILGGPHASILHREIVRKFPQFDLVVRGEAEQPAPLFYRGMGLHDHGFLDADAVDKWLEVVGQTVLTQYVVPGRHPVVIEF